MKNLAKRITLAALLAAALILPSMAAPKEKTAAQRMGWELGSQCWTFNKSNFVDTLKQIGDLGLHVAEIYPGQDFSPVQPFKVNHKTTADQRKMIKAAADNEGLKLFSYGVATGKDAEDWEQIFAFAKDMGLEFVNCEPKEGDLALVDQLAKKYDLKVALHDHPKPSPYWNPEAVLAAVKAAKNPERWFSCADTGHWVRSGLNPVDCLKQLQGHIGFLHFKDLNAKEGKSYDVPWGTGVNDAWAELAELKRQNWKGNVLVEYEAWSDNRFTEIRDSIDFFNMAAAAMDEDGWQPLFKPDLSNAQGKPGVWEWNAEGVLSRKQRGDLWTKEKYGDFVLDLDFRCHEKTNSGVFVRTGSVHDWLHTAIEIQILQQVEQDSPVHNMGSIYDVKAPTAVTQKPAGEWNHFTIITCRYRIYVVLNGSLINSIDLSQWTQPGKNPDGTPNKFRYAYKDMPWRGFVGVQDHGEPVEFRNLRIKTID